jgi:chromosome segregation ATPase
MITLTEKRLRELENHIAVYEATLSTLRDKLLQADTFPDAISAIKSDLTELRSALSTTDRDLRTERKLDLNAWNQTKENIDCNSNNIARLEKCISNVDSIVHSHTVEFDKLKANIQELLNKNVAILGLISESHNDSKLIKANIKDMELKLARIESQGHYHTDSINKLQQIIDSQKTTISGYDTFLERYKTIVSAKLDTLESRFNTLNSAKPAEPTNYDAPIATIKKDLATILSLHQNLSTHISEPPSSKITDKVAILEKSIAQIFAILKKYEPT